MDIITDLSSHAVTYLTIVQDICTRKKKHTSVGEEAYLWDVFNEIKGMIGEALPKDLQERVNELIFSPNVDTAIEIKHKVFLLMADKLLHWLESNFFKSELPVDIERPDLRVTPDYWRSRIRQILYKIPKSRISLVEAMHYMPVQIVFAIYGKPPENLPEQRLYQVYISEDNESQDDLIALLGEKNVKANQLFWYDHAQRSYLWAAPSRTSQILSLINEAIDDKQKKNANEKGENTNQEGEEKGKFEHWNLSMAAAFLLRESSILLYVLNKRALTVPFSTLFEDELEEIEALRRRREIEFYPEEKSKFPLEATAANTKYDPEKKADQMNLAGLAFSGGGIRSATFNLGILQKLAELGALPRFDYLSTVSGGGYIGAWYASWIHRNGSLKNINNRLNNKKSTDPMAEEVRPIRWLRMYSNYLSPNSSIMSVDAWTVGITWLRNTFINQIILLLILVTLLAAINASFAGWVYLKVHRIDFLIYILGFCFGLMIIGVCFAAIGMRTYSKQNQKGRLFLVGRNKVLPYGIIFCVVLSAIATAVWFLSEDQTNSFQDKMKHLSPCGISCLLAMIFIAFIGGYHLKEEKKMGLKDYTTLLVMFILASSALASGALVLLLAIAWESIQWIANVNYNGTIYVFIYGIPIILEAFCITVVVRMAIMGKHFPDERREWWGRMGGMMHRFIFWWIIVTLAALWFPKFFDSVSYCFNTQTLLPLVGGWAGVVGIAVKMAYSSTKSGDKPSGKTQQAKDIFVRVAPYLFMAGFLLIGASVLELIEDIPCLIDLPQYCQPLCLALSLAAITLLLSWRVGVNEFSLHDFYRNRLVRAYMGGTRRRTDREKTANRFTGFDKEDEIPLASFQTRKSATYSGPYPLVNTALNATTVSELDRQDRMAESFVFSPLYCGFDFNATRSSASMKNNIFNFGYRPTEHYSREAGPLLGTAMAISGAAVSPNMGYHSSSATAFLLTMFNLRLGRWIGNPRKCCWKFSDPGLGLGYLLSDLIGKSDINNKYVYLSDGGHFDNMGLYELVRRRCSYIVLGDGEQDENAICEGLANAIRRCRIDFGVEIDIDVSAVTLKNKNTQLSKAHMVTGTIKYPNNPKPGTLVYVKTAMTKIEMRDADIREYNLRNPKFPQESTGDQFFDEAQFESYRKLGYNSIDSLVIKIPT